MYSAEFEVFPEFKPKLTRWKSFEESKITIESDDIDLAVADILERAPKYLLQQDQYHHFQ